MSYCQKDSIVFVLKIVYILHQIVYNWTQVPSKLNSQMNDKFWKEGWKLTD